HPFGLRVFRGHSIAVATGDPYSRGSRSRSIPNPWPDSPDRRIRAGRTGPADHGVDGVAELAERGGCIKHRHSEGSLACPKYVPTQNATASATLQDRAQTRPHDRENEA